MEDKIELTVQPHKRSLLERLGLLPPRLEMPCVNCGQFNVRQDRFRDSHVRADGSTYWSVACWSCKATYNVIERPLGPDDKGQLRFEYRVRLPRD